LHHHEAGHGAKHAFCCGVAPPSTGKTQTIAAVVEAQSKHGKRMLFSAATPSAVEVIGRRLSGIATYGVCSVRPGQILCERLQN